MDTINEYLNLKEVYERNKKLIKTTKVKGVYSWYPTYFLQAWNEAWPSIQRAFHRQFKKGGDAGTIMEKILNKRMNEICIKGIQKMLDGPEVEAAGLKDDPALKEAYKDLVNYIGDIHTKGSMANQIYKAYQLDELKQNLIKQAKTQFNKKEMTKKATKDITKSIHSRGGFSLEAIETAILQKITTSLQSGNVTHSGDTLIKADNILTFNVASQTISDTLEEVGKDREENIEAFNALGEKLKNIKDGFIIYSSDKNYSLNKNFKGFSAGSISANAESFISQVYKGQGAMNTLLGAINQLGKGAILQGQEGDYETLLAQDVAYMLFDDYVTIGVESSGGGNAIHVMNFNGIVMPLSAILYLLAEAIESALQGNINKIVKVDIDAPAIYFGSNAAQSAWQKANNASAMEAWEFQKQYALSNTKISAHILKNFKSLISQYL